MVADGIDMEPRYFVVCRAEVMTSPNYQLAPARRNTGIVRRWAGNRSVRVGVAVFLGSLLAAVTVRAQEPDSRSGSIAQAQAEKARQLQPEVPSRVERLFESVENRLVGGGLNFFPFFESAYAGGGFTLGGGWGHYVGSYDTLALRGSYTIKGYKRMEAEFLAPRLLRRRAVLSVLGGWREATQVGFWGTGTGTSADDRANYSFRQPYGSASLEVRPTRRLLVLGGGMEYSRWEQREGSGSAPSVETVYTPDTLPGLNATTTYLHTRGTLALDGRTSPGYTRTGGYYGVTVHNFADRDDVYSFHQVDYEAIQHVPVLHDAWVLSLRARVETTTDDPERVVPFFMLPALGGGSTLRGYASWRFRDRHSLLLSAEWRALLNNFVDMALFYDGGKVVADRSDLGFDALKHDFGIGFRFHGPVTMPLRIELARGNEGMALVFSSKAAF